jgi:hypothetical protein
VKKKWGSMRKKTATQRDTQTSIRLSNPDCCRGKKVTLSNDIIDSIAQIMLLGGTMTYFHIGKRIGKELGKINI